MADLPAFAELAAKDQGLVVFTTLRRDGSAQDSIAGARSGRSAAAGSLTSIGVYVGEDWWTHLSTYHDHTPILDISAGSAMVALSLASQEVNAPAVEFARELASQAAKFAAEVERLHARHPGGNAEATGSTEAGAGEAA